MGLQQKHVVAVKVWAHTTTVGGITDHHIVQTGVGHKTELVHQGMHALVMQIHALHQQGPASLLKRRQGLACKRAVFETPTRGTLGRRLHHQPRFHFLLRRQVQQLSPVQQRCKARNRLPDHQWFFLPVALHKGFWRESAQQLQRFLDVHGTILLWKSHHNASLP